MIQGIIFDIETGPLPIEQLIEQRPEFEAPSNYGNHVKIEAYIKKQEEKWLEKAALNAATGQILAIGILGVDGDDQNLSIIDQHEYSERDLLIHFWDMVTTSQITKWIGFNIFGFDLPFLFRRSLVHGVTPSFPIRNNRYWDHRFIDLMDVYTCGNRDQRISLDNLAKMVGLEGKSGSGADFEKWFYSDPNRARAYLTKDLELTADIASKMIAWIQSPSFFNHEDKATA